MTKPRLGKVRALFYVLQQATEKEAAPILTQPPVKYRYGLSRGDVALLMGRTQKVVDRLDGIESGYRHFDKGRVPVAHGAVPEARELHSPQFLAVA